MKMRLIIGMLLGTVGASAQSANTVTLTGGLTFPRQGHTATLLPNGKVLIAGGYANAPGFGTWNTAELYDPASGTFTLAGNMTAARSWHSATLLPDGKVLLAGGATFVDGKQTSLGSAELYDPLTGTFTPTGSMSAGRVLHVAVWLPNGKVLFEGGNSCDDNPNPELYDPASGQFTLTGPAAYPASWDLSAVSASLLPRGNVLITLDVGCDAISEAEVYDFANGTFAPTVRMSGNRGYNTTTLLPEGRVLIARQRLHG
ncbi:MAG TPA: kelch repeat-containing protein [Bryobacteraceae bacterium]|jgi:hypothetical protein